MRKHLLALVGILTVASGCDNVVWGGVDVGVRYGTSADSVSTEVEEEQPEVAISGRAPLLLAGRRDGARGDFVVVGAVRGPRLTAFPDPGFPGDMELVAELTAAGSEWVVFSEGVRVGRMTVDRSGPAPGYCGARQAVSGIVELVAPAAAAERLMALPADVATEREYGPYRPIAHNYDQRVATLSIAGEVIPTVGAPWPPGGILSARTDIRAFEPLGRDLGSVAATFLYNDRADLSEPGQRAWSLFLIGEDVEGSYEASFYWHRSADDEGKGVPLYFDHLDWTGDGRDEVLLEMFGTERRWFAALSRRPDSWTTTFEDPCGPAEVAPG